MQLTLDVKDLAKRAFNKVKRSLLLPCVFFPTFELSSVIENRPSALLKNPSIPELYCRFPRRIQRLFRHLDLEKPGLMEVRLAVDQKDWITACQTLVAYYETHEIPARLRPLGTRQHVYSRQPPHCILSDTFTFQQKTDVVPRRMDGGFHWDYCGPVHDREWAWFLNRHYQVLDLLHAYQQTKDQVYINYINSHLLDWLTSSICQPNYWWAQWRGREVALRVIHWASLFYGLRFSEELGAATRILMLSSLLDHAFYLRRLHHWGGNWLCREMSGLATIALCWQEFKPASEWLSYALKHLVREVDRQVYPDGTHKELTSLYHRIVVQDLQNVVELLLLTKQAVPPPLHTCIEKMVNYLAYTVCPEGRAVQNNDSDQDNNRSFIQQAAIAHERPDWAYIASNGKVGHSPTAPFSVAFPWAGQVISRSGWDEQAHWSFFDIGPLGTNYHEHYDKLHLSLAAGRHLLVDSGRYCYRRDRFWPYFRHSASHNVILIDGKGQGASHREQLTPLTDHYVLAPQFDFAWGRFKGPFVGLKGKAIHTRAIVYLRSHYWVVVDYIESDRPRVIEPLWHFHPACTVAIEAESVVSTNPEVSNLRIVPVAPFPWQVKFVAGQTEPIQGWWSQEYNHLVPNPTAIYSASIGTSANFAWVLYPATGSVPPVDVKVVSMTAGGLTLSISEPILGTTIVAVCLGQETTITLSDDLVLIGRCAVLISTQPPLVALGEIRDRRGNLLTESTFSSSAALTRKSRL